MKVTEYRCNNHIYFSVSSSIGRRPPHINDVSWSLKYHMKVWDYVLERSGFFLSFFLLLLAHLSNMRKIKNVVSPTERTGRQGQRAFLLHFTERGGKSRTQLNFYLSTVVRFPQHFFCVRMKDPRKTSTSPARWSSYRLEQMISSAACLSVSSCICVLFYARSCSRVTTKSLRATLNIFG